ncbi:MAG: hypothetical protein LKI53_05300 [Bacteroidales bacterium]|nr:hypothetical protein [Bacteroidales bacterium]
MLSTFILEISKTLTDYNFIHKDDNKFEGDNVDYNNSEYFVMFCGVSLNKKDLLCKYGLDKDSWSRYFINSYEKEGETFFYEIKGTFCGAFYDKVQKKWILFSDHIGSKAVYYAEYKDYYFISNNYVDLMKYMREKGSSFTLNEFSAYLLLTYGYTFEELTITNEIKRIMIGKYVVIENSRLLMKDFYKLKENHIKIEENDAIKEIDKRFRHALKQAFEKDNEYGYKHVANLSGGLDSRMTVWVAHEIGYTNQLNITFSQSGYLDEKIARAIAVDLKHEWIFKALDNGSFLTDVDNVTKITGGNVLYYGLAHGLSLYKYLNWKNLGILHSGQLGDVILSSSFSSDNDDENKNRLGLGAYSTALLDRVSDYEFRGDYGNLDIFKIFIRGFYGANQGLKDIMRFTETYSPFYDIDFMDFVLSLPVKMRYNHYIYKKWILKEYPQAASYIWEKEKVPVNYPFWINLGGRKLPLKEIPVKILSRLGISKYGANNKNNMNPLDYWYRTNNDLTFFLDTYFNDNIGLLSAYPELKHDCENLYFNHTATEKNQVISLLSACKIIME